MIRPSEFNFEYPSNELEVIECHEGATASGTILLNIDGLDDVLEYATAIYAVNPPDADQESWTTSGEDLYEAPVFNLAFVRKSTGKLSAEWCFDPEGFSQGFYSVIMKINSESHADVKQACIEFIVKVKNSITIGY